MGKIIAGEILHEAANRGLGSTEEPVAPRGPVSSTGGTGATGPTGPISYSRTGPTGPNGASSTGPTGAPGFGTTGPTGPAGSGGSNGTTGATGQNGTGTTLSYGIISLAQSLVATATTVSASGVAFSSYGSDVSYTLGQANFTVQPGIYDVVASVDWATPNANGYRSITLTSPSGSFSISNTIPTSGNSTDTVQQLPWIGQFAAHTTLNLQYLQDSGSSLVVVPTANSYISLVKIG